MLKTLTARKLLTENGSVDYPVISVEEGQILSVEAGPQSSATDTLSASFLDIHVHGAISHDFMAANSQQIDSVGRFLATRGVGAYLPTTVTGPIDLTLRALETLANSIEATSPPSDVATPVAIHLEGPFVSHVRRGVHPEAYIVQPSVELFDRFQQAARGHIRLITVAPEMPGALELVRHAAAQGVRVSMGHSDATEAQALSGLESGATSGTHLFNAMRAINQREPGILGVLLDSDRLYAEVICDGIHVHPALIRLWLKAKGQDRGILVTDGMSATGMPDGTYTLGDFKVEVRDGVCMSNGTLAGSVLTMDQAVANLVRFTGSPLGVAVRQASTNPARMLGMEHLTSLQPGCLANFNVFDEGGSFKGSILRGARVQA